MSEALIGTDPGVVTQASESGQAVMAERVRLALDLGGGAPSEADPPLLRPIYELVEPDLDDDRINELQDDIRWMTARFPGPSGSDRASLAVGDRRPWQIVPPASFRRQGNVAKAFALGKAEVAERVRRALDVGGRAPSEADPPLLRLIYELVEPDLDDDRISELRDAIEHQLCDVVAARQRMARHRRRAPRHPPIQRASAPPRHVA